MSIKMGINKQQITVRELIQHLNNLNQNAVVYLPVDPEQNGFHLVDIYTPVSYGIRRLKDIGPHFNFEKDYKTDVGIVIINAGEYKDDNYK